MPKFRIFYLARERSEAFRGKTGEKPPYAIRRSHYEEGPEVCAADPYALWKSLRESNEPGADDVRKSVDVGDVLESESGLLLCNYWGFEPAEWRDGPMNVAGEADGPPASETSELP